MATATDTVALPTAADVDAAAKKLAGVAIRTPLINSPVLDARLGARVFLKAETLQRTGSFKFRGAYNRISSIPQDRRAAGASAGMTMVARMPSSFAAAATPWAWLPEE